VQRLRPEVWRQRNWLFASWQCTISHFFFTTEFLTKHSVTVVPHPPYSPDLAPCVWSHQGTYKSL
jgi:hypothetical protein